jgi:chromosome segregation ATPase
MGKNKKKLRGMDVKSPNKFPTIFNDDIDILQSFMDSTTASMEEMKTLVRSLRQKVVEESSSKVTVDQLDALNNKFLDLGTKMLTIKKESLVMRKNMKTGNKVDTNVEVVARRANDELDVVKEELSQLKGAMFSNINEIKKSQKDSIKKELDAVAKAVTVADELPVEREVTVSELNIEDKVVKQIMKQLFKNNEDIASLQRQINEKNAEIEDLRGKLDNLG